MKPIQEILPLLNGGAGKKIAILVHAKPDADAMGAALGLRLLLLAKGHSVLLITPTGVPYFLDFLPGIETVQNLSSDRENIKRQLIQMDLVFALDFNHWQRALLADTDVPVPSVLIDHHQDPHLSSFTYGLSLPAYSSTCEVLYDWFEEAQWLDGLNKDVATCLYTGIVGDTGSFKFASVTGALHQKVARLLAFGVAHTQVHTALFDNNSENKLRFIGHVLHNRMIIRKEYGTALIYATKQDLSDFHMTTGETEGVVHLPMSLQGVYLAAFFMENIQDIRCSFRTKQTAFDVNIFSGKYFKGGGHKMAAGGRADLPVSEGIDYFWRCVAPYKEQILGR